MTWIQTYSGKAFDLENPTPDMVDLDDICHALSFINRFTGHAQQAHSVATHSFLVAYLVPREFHLHALLHDAAEAYVGDMAAPLKRLLRKYDPDAPFLQVEQMVTEAIADHFGLPRDFAHCDVVKRADLQVLSIEREVFMADAPKDWGTEAYRHEDHDYMVKWLRANYAEPLYMKGAFRRAVKESIKLRRAKRWI